MAVQARASKLHFLVVLLTISLSCFRVQCIQEFIGTCGLTIDLFQSQIVNSGILRMALPDSMDAYQDPARQRYCDIIINFASGQNLMIELYFLDIMPKTGDITTCSTGLRIFDQNDRQYYGSILCMQGWQWEERHREKQNEKLLVPNSPLTIRLISTAPYTGEGFKMHFNQIRPTWPCVLREFRCRQVQYCVNDDLTCDGWDDCGDYSDERIEAGCNLLTPSEICALIIGILLLLGSVVAVFIFCITCRRLSRDYGMRSESKVPIVVNNYNLEPTLGASRGYYSQESIPSKYSRSTALRRDSDGDTIDKADLEKADKNSNRTGDNMSERSIRSNPRRLQAQATTLGTEAAPPEPIKKSGSYSYGGRRGRAISQSSLNRSKGELASDKEDAMIRNNLENELVESTEKLSEKDRSGRYRDRDRYSDSDDYYDRDRYDDDRKRRSSRERDRRRSGRYSDEEDSDYDRDRDYRRRRRSGRYSDDDDSDYDRDRDYRRRRRRSYDRYSEDEDSEYERERRRRRSKERYSREKLNDQDNSDVEGDGEKDNKRPSKRQDSKERDRSRERYIRDRLDDEDSDRGRRLDKERSYRRDSRERDRDRYRDDDEDSDRGRRLDKERSYYRRDSRERDRDRDDDDRPVRRRRSEEKRRGTSTDRDRLSGDLSKNENMRSRSRENIQSRDRGRRSPPLPAPPPYTEEDTKPYLQKQSTYVEDKRFTQSQSLPPPPDDLPQIEMTYISNSHSRTKKALSSEDRSREQQLQKTPPSEDKIRETKNEKLLSSEDKFRKQKNEKLSSPEDKFREPQNEKLSSPEDKFREPQNEKLSSSSTKYRDSHKLSASDVRHHEQQSLNSSLSEVRYRESQTSEVKYRESQTSEVKYRESQTQKLSSVDVKYREPQKPPTSNDVYKEKQIQKPPPSEVRYREPFKLRTLEVDLKQDGQKLPPKEVNDVDRRRHTDDRRERYSRARWTPKKKELDSPPPEYEDVAPKSVYVSASYREESV